MDEHAEEDKCQILGGMITRKTSLFRKMWHNKKLRRATLTLDARKNRHKVAQNHGLKEFDK